MTVNKTNWLIRIIFAGLCFPIGLFASHQSQESAEAPPSAAEIADEIVRDEDLMKALLAEELDTMRDAAIRLIERADKSQEKLDTFFGEAFEKFQENPERLSELLGIFDYFNLFSRAAYQACENFMKTQQPQHPAWDSVARSYFHQKFLLNAAVWRAKQDALSEEELLIIRLYSLPVDLWLLRSIVTQPDKFSEAVQLAAIDALWWVYCMGRIEIHESLALVFENENNSARIIEAAIEPLQYLYAGFSYPQISPYLSKTLQTRAVIEASPEHREKIEGIIKQFNTHAEEKWAEKIQVFDQWIQREQEIRSDEANPLAGDSATLMTKISGRWILDQVSCVLENGDELFIDSIESAIEGNNELGSQDFLEFEADGRFKMTKRFGEIAPPYNKLSAQRSGKVFDLKQTSENQSLFLFRVLKESLIEEETRNDFQLSVLESVERSFEATLSLDDDRVVLTIEKTSTQSNSDNLCVNGNGMKKRKYFKRF